MSPLHRQNLILGGLILLLGVALWPQRPPPAGPPAGLSELDPAKVRTIRIGAADTALAIQLSRDGESWRLSAPIAAPADPLSVAELLAILSRPVARRLSLEGVELAELGLAPAQYRIDFDAQSFLIGARESLSGQHYLLHGQQLSLVADLPLERLDLDYADLVQRRLLPIDTPPQAILLGGKRHQDPARLERWREARALWLDRAQRDEHAAGGQRLQIEHAGGRITFIRLPDDAGLLRPDWDLVYRLPPSAYSELLPADA